MRLVAERVVLRVGAGYMRLTTRKLVLRQMAHARGLKARAQEDPTYQMPSIWNSVRYGSVIFEGIYRGVLSVLHDLIPFCLCQTRCGAFGALTNTQN